MIGFNKVMRFCNTLQDYESAKNKGTITDDLFVVILQDKLAKFKGQTFDWSQNADLTALATKGELEDLAEEIASNERVWAEALNDLNEKINEIGTGGGGVSSTEEIYIGETEPTDENVKVWINPAEQGTGGTGGSSASGEVLKIMFCDNISGFQTFNGQFTPAKWDEFIASMEGTEGMPDFKDSEYDKAVRNAFSHNIKTYQTLLAKAKFGESVQCVLDMSSVKMGLIKFSSSVQGIDTSNLGVMETIPLEIMVHFGSEAFFTQDIIEGLAISLLLNKKVDVRLQSDGGVIYYLNDISI